MIEHIKTKPVLQWPDSPSPQQLKDLRAKYHLTQRQVAHMLYVTTQAIGACEQGSRTMSPSSYELLLIKVKQ